MKKWQLLLLMMLILMPAANASIIDDFFGAIYSSFNFITGYAVFQSSHCSDLNAIMQRSWHKSCGDAGYDYVADVSGPRGVQDGTVDIYDLSLFADYMDDERWCQEQLGSTDNPCISEELCSDGTPYGQCSVTKPLYCYSGSLRDDCSMCGCPSGETCQGDGSCIGQNCSDLNAIMQRSWHKSCGDAGYDYVADVSGPRGVQDGTVDIYDLSLFADYMDDERWCQEQLGSTDNPCTETTCRDSDAGLEQSPLYIKGTVAFTNDPVYGTGTQTDFCGRLRDPASDANKVYEWYCVSDKGMTYVTGTEYDCPNGCEDGACISGEMCIDDQTKEYTCSDGSKVPWCVCESGQWTCITSPENQCQCSDGTQVSQCSTDKPLYCARAVCEKSPCPPVLVDKCSLCGCPLGHACQPDESCTPPSEIDGIITVQTLKSDYAIGEIVNLTDPPPNTLPEPFPVTLLETVEEPPEMNGYIIRFKEKSIVEKADELEGEIDVLREGLQKTAQEYIDIKMEGLNIINPLVWIAKWSKENELKEQAKILTGKLRNFQTEVTVHKGKIEQIHNTFKTKVDEELPGRKILGEYRNVFNGIAVDITGAEAKKIKQLEYVEDVYPNYKVEGFLMDSIPLIYAGDVWNLQDPQGDYITGKGITIGIIDTGIDYTHPDLGTCTTDEFLTGACDKVIGGYDFVNSDNDPLDDHGHGTHCAGTAAGNGALKGVAPDAKLYGYKVLNSEGWGYSDDVIAAIERSIDPNQDGDFSDHLDVISLSLGGDGNPDDPKSQAIDNAVDAGVVAVIAAGNSGSAERTIASPGTARKAITVGATYKKDYSGQYWDIDPKVDQITLFSSRGPVIWEGGSIIKPDVVAPGAIICAARYDEIFPEGQHQYYYPCYDEQHVQLAGTSMATPHVAGAVALIKQAHPDWAPLETKMALRNTAGNIGEPINTQGYGRIDVLAVVQSDVPPVAYIETSGLISEVTDIMGTAAGNNLENYKLYYGKSFDPVSWTEIYSSTTPINNGILYAGFNPYALEDGDYSLRLTVAGTNGEISEDRTLFSVDNIKVSYPLSDDIFRAGDVIEIKGTAIQDGFQNYVIEYEVEREWLTTGIDLANGGNNPVVNDTLAMWDTSAITETNSYTMRLTVNYAGRQSYEEKTIYFDTSLKEGWPITIPWTVEEGHSPPGISELPAAEAAGV